MDGTAAFGPLRARGCISLHRPRPTQPRGEGRHRRRADVANELRTPRKRTVDRDRSSLCFVDGAGIHLLVELVARGALALARVDSALDFSWAWLARKRAAQS